MNKTTANTLPPSLGQSTAPIVGDAVEALAGSQIHADNEGLNYIERGRITDAAVMRARLEEDASKINDFKIEINGMEDRMVKAGCTARELGLSFQTYYLPPNKESAEVWFNKHYAKALRIDYEMFKWIKSASEKVHEAPRTIADVMPMQQLLLLAAGKIDKPLRTEAQLSHAQTPYNFFFNTFRALATDAEKRLKDAPRWNLEMFPPVREEFERQRQFMDKAMADLERAEAEAKNRALSSADTGDVAST